MGDKGFAMRVNGLSVVRAKGIVSTNAGSITLFAVAILFSHVFQSLEEALRDISGREMSALDTHGVRLNGMSFIGCHAEIFHVHVI